MITLPPPLPVVHYFRCVDDTSKPVGYVGNWPQAEQVYAGKVKPAAHTGVPHLHLDGFWAAAPWGAFAVGRFEHAFSIWLN